MQSKHGRLYSKESSLTLVCDRAFVHWQQGGGIQNPDEGSSYIIAVLRESCRRGKVGGVQQLISKAQFVSRGELDRTKEKY